MWRTPRRKLPSKARQHWLSWNSLFQRSPLKSRTWFWKGRRRLWEAGQGNETLPADKLPCGVSADRGAPFASARRREFAGRHSDRLGVPMAEFRDRVWRHRLLRREVWRPGFPGNRRRDRKED